MRLLCGLTVHRARWVAAIRFPLISPPIPPHSLVEAVAGLTLVYQGFLSTLPIVLKSEHGYVIGLGCRPSEADEIRLNGLEHFPQRCTV